MGIHPGPVAVHTLHHEGWDELVLTLLSTPEETAAESLVRAISLLHREGADLLHATVFCRVTPDGSPVVAPRATPATFVEGAPCHSGLVAGVHAVGARGTDVTFCEAEHGAMAAVVEDARARWTYVTAVQPAELWAAPAVQAREAFERAEATLKLAGMDFRNVFRTWLYLDRILDWYSELNRVRTTFYNERGVLSGVVPASTGIGVANAVGAAVLMDLLAAAPKDGSVRVERVSSPLQCSAQDYGSSFSRAVEVRETGLRRLLVSGTASIAADGRTLHQGDVVAQTDRTLDVVEAILRSRGMDWQDVNRVVVYLRDAGDLAVFEGRWSERRCPCLPIVVAGSIVCRDDLLVEVELDAAIQAN